jgi:hypothetical protein
MILGDSGYGDEKKFDFKKPGEVRVTVLPTHTSMMIDAPLREHVKTALSTLPTAELAETLIDVTIDPQDF